MENFITFLDANFLDINKNHNRDPRGTGLMEGIKFDSLSHLVEGSNWLKGGGGGSYLNSNF